MKNCGQDIVFVSLLKRVLNKTAYCVHCEVCEVECPSGALSVVPCVSVDASKCIGCGACVKNCNVNAINIFAVKEQKVL